MNRAITDVWHGEAAGARRLVPEEQRMTHRWRTTFRMCALSFRADAIITSQGARSVYGLAFLAAFLVLTGQRKIFLVEFLPGERSGLRGRVAASLYRMFLGRACSGIQVMTPWERDDYIERYRLPPRIVHLIPLSFYDDRVAGAPRSPRVPRAELKIMSSGRNSCDWDTLLDAADGQGWDLTIVATPTDSERIRDRVSAVGVTLLTDIPRDEHDALLAVSDLFVLTISPTSRSAGQVRLMSAATYGLPVVATDAPGIQGYEMLACATTPTSDAEALRDIVNAFRNAPGSLTSRAREVQEVARTRPRSRYVADVVDMFRSAERHGRAAAARNS